MQRELQSMEGWTTTYDSASLRRRSSAIISSIGHILFHAASQATTLRTGLAQTAFHEAHARTITCLHRKRHPRTLGYSMQFVPAFRVFQHPCAEGHTMSDHQAPFRIYRVLVPMATDDDDHRLRYLIQTS